MLSKIFRWIVNLRVLRSMRVRVFVFVLIVGIIPGFIMRYGIVSAYKERALKLRIETIVGQMKILSNHLMTYDFLKDTSSDVINAELYQFANMYDGRIMIVGENYKVIKDTYAMSEGKTIISEDVIKAFKTAADTSNYDDKEELIEVVTPVLDVSAISGTDSDAQSGDTKGKIVHGVMIASVSIEYIRVTTELLVRKAQILQTVMSVFVVGIVAFLATFLLRPFKQVTDAINAFKGEDSAEMERFSIPNYVETEHIMEAFNHLRKRMKALDDSRQNFVSDVSHELKTPLTSIKVLADSLITQQNVPVELYKEFMVDIAEEVDRENKIINDLLSLVRLEKRVVDLNIETIDINNMVEKILKRLRPLAVVSNIELTFESLCAVSAQVDEVKLSFVITNLVENAIKYNRHQGWVHVQLDADHQFFRLEVSDSGIGIPESEIDSIYERFHRVEKSRARSIGGTGLGLAIARRSVLLHRGSINVESVVEQGSTFKVKIPLIYAEAK